MAQKAGITIEVVTSKAVQGVLKLAQGFAEVVEKAENAGNAGKVLKLITKPAKLASRAVKGLTGWVGKKLVGALKGAKGESGGFGKKLIFLNQALELGRKALGLFTGALTAGMQASRDLRGDFDPLIRNFDKLATKSRATSAAVGDAFIAAYTGILTAIEETSSATRDWMIENRSLIATKIVEWLGRVAKVLVTVATPAAKVFVGVWAGLKLAAQAATLAMFKSVEKMASVMAKGARYFKKNELAQSLENWRDAAMDTGEDIKGQMADTVDKTAETLLKVSEAGAKAYAIIEKKIPRAIKAAQAAIDNASATPLVDQQERLLVAGEKLLALWPRSEKAFQDMVKGMPFEEQRTQIELVEAEVDKFNRMLSIGGRAAIDDVAGPLQALLDKFGLDHQLNIEGNAEEVVENMTRATDILSGALMKVKEDATLANDQVLQVTESQNKALEVQTQYQDELTAAAQMAAEGMGDAFALMIKGSEDAAAAFKEMGRSMVLSVYDAVTKAVMAYAAEAAAGAAKSQAGIPVAGPALAVAAAGTMFAFVRGLLGGMMTGAAAGGFVGTGGNKLDRRDTVGPFMLAPGEYIMPTDEVSALRRFLGQMGATSGGGSLTGGSTQTSATTNEINLEFKSDQLPNRTETKRWVKTTVLPALRELQAVGY
jgi:hypothetical protein